MPRKQAFESVYKHWKKNRKQGITDKTFRERFKILQENEIKRPKLNRDKNHKYTKKEAIK